MQSINGIICLKPKSCHDIAAIIKYITVKAPVFGTLNSAISNFQTWFVRTVMEVSKFAVHVYVETITCSVIISLIQIINSMGDFF